MKHIPEIHQIKSTIKRFKVDNVKEFDLTKCQLNRMIALRWWKSLSQIIKESFIEELYSGRKFSSLTGFEIEQIYKIKNK